MKLGILVNKQHINFIPFISFLTAQIADRDDVEISIINDASNLKDISLCDINLIVNRYCLINIDKLFNKKYLNDIFFLPCHHKKSIVLFPKKSITIKEKNLSINEFIRKNSISDHKTFGNICHLANIGCVNCKTSSCTFLCFNDLDDNFIDFLKSYFYKHKEIYYNNNIYIINPNTNLFKYDGSDACLINKNLSVCWDNVNNKWKKLNKGIKKIC